MVVKTMIVTLGELDLQIWLHTAQTPSDAEWDAGIQLLIDYKAAHHGDLSRYRVLAVSDGGRPGLNERTRFTSIYEKRAVPTAAVTIGLSNAVMRGVATALSWLNPGFKAHGPDQFDAAIGHLGLARFDREILMQLEVLQKELAPLKTLARIRASRAGATARAQ